MTRANCLPVPALLIVMGCVSDPALVDPTVDTEVREAEVADTTASLTFTPVPCAVPHGGLERTHAITLEYRDGADRILGACRRAVVEASLAWFEALLAENEYEVQVWMDVVDFVEALGPEYEWAIAVGGGWTHEHSRSARDRGGRIRFNSRLVFVYADYFHSVFRHEMLHVLGIGASPEWHEHIVDHGGSDFAFTGERASAVFREHDTGSVYVRGGVPASNQASVAGGGTHWRWHYVDGDIMSTGGGAIHATALTLAALEDIGWTVDHSLAENGLVIGNHCDWCFGHAVNDVIRRDSGWWPRASGVPLTPART